MIISLYYVVSTVLVGCDVINWKLLVVYVYVVMTLEGNTVLKEGWVTLYTHTHTHTHTHTM